MSRLQVLVATMHRNDFSLYRRMNLQSDAIFANQNGENAVASQEIDGHRVTMISTDTIGVGCNRNIALLSADADIFLFADDDVVYYDGYADAVLRAFEQQPDADLIAFGMRFSRNGEVFLEKSHPFKRRRVWNSLNYGTYCIAVRKRFFLQKHIFFSHLFGGGCKFSCGEDSLYLLDCLRAGGRLYSHPYILGVTARDNSSWFKGYTRKFYYDKGVWLAAAFPKTKYLMMLYFIFRFQKLSELSRKTQSRLMKVGIRNYPNLICYTDDIIPN